jgi:hypothetical protein
MSEENSTRKDLPLEYQGYIFLNKEVYFKGGISGFHAIIFFLAIAFSTIILMMFKVNIVFLLLIDTCIVAFMIKQALKLSKHNLAGDRDYLASSFAWKKSPKEIRDYGFLKNVLNNERKINI